MNNYTFKNRDGSTPLDLDQLNGILLPHITTMGELDEVEDLNIQKGLDWLNHQNADEFLTITFLNKFHKKLFEFSMEKCLGMKFLQNFIIDL